MFKRKSWYCALIFLLCLGEEVFSQEACPKPLETFPLPVERFFSQELPSLFKVHPEALHWVSMTSKKGRVVEIEDGSLWKVRASDASSVKQWLESDTLYVLPNTSWWSSFNYCLHNLELNTTVKANLVWGPLRESPYAHRISDLKREEALIALGKDSYWEVCHEDQGLLSAWEQGDFVILGLNQDSKSHAYPYILINILLDQYIRVTDL